MFANLLNITISCQYHTCMDEDLKRLSDRFHRKSLKGACTLIIFVAWVWIK